MALYVYGLMRADDARAAVASIREDEALPAVDAVECRGLEALVTDVPDAAARIRREAVTAHAEVLQAAFEHGPVLPIRFGTVLADREAVVGELLERRADALLARLGALEGRAEMLVKATYLEEPLLRSILHGNRSLALAVERIRKLPAAATHFERIRIGEAIAGAVEARRASDSEAMLGALTPLSVAVSVSNPQHERSALNASFLIDRSSLERFDAAVERLSELYAADMQFKLIGPLPAHSFADREWETAGAAREASSAWA